MLGPSIVASQAPAALHLWLDLAEVDAERVAARALRAGVSVTPAGAPIIDATLISGLRICLGGAPDRETLRRALGIVASSLSAAPDDRLVF